VSRDAHSGSAKMRPPTGRSPPSFWANQFTYPQALQPWISKACVSRLGQGYRVFQGSTTRRVLCGRSQSNDRAPQHLSAASEMPEQIFYAFSLPIAMWLRSGEMLVSRATGGDPARLAPLAAELRLFGATHPLFCRAGKSSPRSAKKLQRVRKRAVAIRRLSRDLIPLPLNRPSARRADLANRRRPDFSASRARGANLSDVVGHPAWG
jgi:hypothetical protein